MNRGKWQGMLAIARFNWPFYLAAGLLLILGTAAFFLVHHTWQKWLLALLIIGSSYFIVVSLGVSHLVYDRSDLYRWRWLDQVLKGAVPNRAIFCHSGFDEASIALRNRLPETVWTILDHHDAGTMTERSIIRARSLYPPTEETIAAPFDKWPVENGWADTIFGILAIHELRAVRERAAWFSEAKRSLAEGGQDCHC